MDRRVCYVMGGPVQPDLEARKRAGTQPEAEFNRFLARNDSDLVGTDRAVPGGPYSLRRRIALARSLSRDYAGGEALLASGEDVGFPLALATMARRTRPPVWIVVHGSYLDGRKFAAIAPLLRRARHVHYLCLSEALRDRMVRVLGFDPDRCHDAGYGVDTNFFRPAPPPATPLVVAAGSANRDYATLVRAMSGIETPLRIAADSLWRPREADVGAAPLPATMEVRSAGDYEGLRALYRSASFVVVPLHPARFAAGYAVIAEAMATGRAVIVTRTEAPSDFVEEGRTGFYVEPGDAEGMADRIRSLLADPARAAAMGEAAAARMRTAFSLDAYCGRIESLMGLPVRAAATLSAG